MLHVAEDVAAGVVSNPCTGHFESCTWHCRYANVDPGILGALKVANAAYETGDVKKCYQVALRAVHGLTPESSNFVAFHLLLHVIKSICCGALGPTWTWSQVAPFVAELRTTGERLKRWMPSIMWENTVMGHLETYALGEQKANHPSHL